MQDFPLYQLTGSKFWDTLLRNLDTPKEFSGNNFLQCDNLGSKDLYSIVLKLGVSLDILASELSKVNPQIKSLTPY